MELYRAFTAPDSADWCGSLRGKKVCITGGCGFVGSRIADAFAFAGVREVVLFDLFQPKPLPVPVIDADLVAGGAPNLTAELKELSDVRVLRPTDHVVKQLIATQRRDALWEPNAPLGPVSFRIEIGEISNLADVARAVAGCDVVVHLAAYGMSGKTMLDRVNIERVNVQGTKNVIQSCRDAGVQTLVYASSYNAVFYGQKLTAAPADVDRPPPEAFNDHYSRTKSIAEGLVIAANGTESKGGKTRALATVALRLSGIYGPGEQRHFPRSIAMIKAGLVRFTIGGTTNLVDWAYIDNIAYCFVRTSALLTSVPTGIAAGRSFPVSDHHPINQWRMMQPLIEGMGCPFPRINIPMAPMFYLAAAMDAALLALSPIIALDPFLTRGEILKVGVEHYFAPSASRDIGYAPLVPHQEGMRRTVNYFVKWAAVCCKPTSTRTWLLRVAVLVALLTVAWLYFAL